MGPSVGFRPGKTFFDRLKIDQVWLAWTEDAKDPLTQKLKQEKGQALAALRMGLSRMQMGGDTDGTEELERHPGVLRRYQGA